MSSLDRVKIVVVGDSGVGKSSLVHLLCNGEPVCNPSWTIGCALHVKLHQYKEGTAGQRTFFLEFWDIGGSSGHENSRSVFYTSAHGVILVHDLTNRKSEQNLFKWLPQVLSPSRDVKFNSYDIDSELLADNRLPLIVVGTKYDLVEEMRVSSALSRSSSSFANESGADEIFLNCCLAKSLAPGSGNVVKLCRFFDRVIDRRYFSGSEFNQASLLDRRRNLNTAKSLHGD